MTIREEAVEILCAKAAKIFGGDAKSYGENTRFIEDLGCKSVNLVQLGAALEDEFEVEVPYMQFAELKTFGEAADFIARALGEI